MVKKPHFPEKRLATSALPEHKAAQNINPNAGMAFYDTPASASQPTRKRMAKVKVGLRGLSREQIADKLDTVKTAMTGNANFTTPNPPLTTLGTASTTLRAKIAAIETARANLATAIADGDAAAEAGANYLTQEGAYVQTTSGGDPVKIQSSGFDVQSDGGPIHMTPVQNLGAATGDSPGEIDLNWNPVSGARSYEIQTATDPNMPSSWVFRDNSTKSKVTLTGLTNLSRIWVRVRAIGANNKGGWSDPAESVVP
jgi:hypothetical protein